ncbi:MAG: hypothetical protein U1E65_33255 [Myxococcota bacterium]
MSPRLWLVFGAFSLVACQEKATLDRKLQSFEVTLTSPVGTPDHRCPLPGTPTVSADLRGCPTYLHDSAGNTIAKVGITAKAIANDGSLLDDYESIASVRVVPGQVDPAFRQLRFTHGVAEGQGMAAPEVAFRGSFGDTFIWIEDALSPPRAGDTPGLGQACGFKTPSTCDQFSLSCVNTKPTVGFDPQGLAYCTKGCSADSDCPGGWFCGHSLTDYSGAGLSSACMRSQPTYAAGAAGPIHLVNPNLADVSREESLVTSPFIDQFVEIKRGNMVVTAIRIDGFYVTDTCAIPGYTGDGNADCTPEEKSALPEFNHLFVFNFSRPDDLFPGDRLNSVAGPMSEFVGLTELNFPLWDVDFNRSPQPIPAPINLNDRVIDHFPKLVEPRQSCANIQMNPERTLLVQCDLAMERLEAGRITVKVKSTVQVMNGSKERQNYDKFGQWPVQVDDGSAMGKTFQLVTRDNIPFFDPIALGNHTVNATVTGNLRQVAFDDRSEPIWIVEPRDQQDCGWCKN